MTKQRKTMSMAELVEAFSKYNPEDTAVVEIEYGDNMLVPRVVVTVDPMNQVLDNMRKGWSEEEIEEAMDQFFGMLAKACSGAVK